MSRISTQNGERIQSNILRILFDESPRPLSATQIAALEARDKQFILKLLHLMEKKQLVRNTVPVFSRKKAWVMTEDAYGKYKELLRN